MMKTPLIFLAFFLVFGKVHTQQSTCTVQVVFDDSLSTIIKLIGAGGEVYEISSDTSKYSYYQLKADEISRLQVLTYYQAFTEINEIFYLDDTVQVRVYKEDSEFEYATKTTSQYDDSMQSIFEAFLEKSGNFFVRIKSRDTSYMDSLRTQVIPQFREDALLAYEAIATNRENAIYYQKILTVIYQALYHPFQFNQSEIMPFWRAILAIEKVASLDHELYRIKRGIEDRLGNLGLSLYPEISTEIKDLVATNKLTLLNFWMENCSPCRKFNKEIASNYDALRQKGIEIININADDFAFKWKRASKFDKLKGLNLYAGPYSKLLAYYNPSDVFPVKVLYDSKGQRVELDQITVETLLSVKE